MFRVIATEVAVETTHNEGSIGRAVYPSTSVYDYRNLDAALTAIRQKYGVEMPQDLVQITITAIPGQPIFPEWE